MRPGIAVDRPIDTHLNTGATRAIFERIDPGAINLGHLRAHAHMLSPWDTDVKCYDLLAGAERLRSAATRRLPRVQAA